MVQISTVLTQVSVRSKSEAWGVDAANHIYRFQSPDNWASYTQTQIAGSLKQVSVAADGSVWGVNSANQIYQYQGGDAWNQISGSLVQISVGSASQVWGVNSVNDIYQYQGGNSWAKMPGQLKQVSAAADGTVCGVNLVGTILRYQASNNQWMQLPGHALLGQSGSGPGTFTFVSVLAGPQVYALDPSDPNYNIYGLFQSGGGGWNPWRKAAVTYFSGSSDMTWGEINQGVTTIYPYVPE